MVPFARDSPMAYGAASLSRNTPIELRDVRTGAAVEGIHTLRASKQIVSVTAGQAVVLNAAIHNVIARAAEQKVLAAMPTDQVVPGAAVDEVVAFFPRERIVRRAADDDVVPFAATDEHGRPSSTDQNVVTPPTLRNFDFSQCQIQRDALIAHDLGNVVAGSRVDVRLKIIGVDH